MVMVVKNGEGAYGGPKMESSEGEYVMSPKDLGASTPKLELTQYKSTKRKGDVLKIWRDRINVSHSICWNPQRASVWVDRHIRGRR